jgi:hypothetical protein
VSHFWVDFFSLFYFKNTLDTEAEDAKVLEAVTKQRSEERD